MATSDVPLKTIASVKAMTSKPSPFLSIGTFTFGLDEHPPELEFGLEQKDATHDAIGGTRTTFAMGAFGTDVTWNGDLFGNNLTGGDPATGLNVAGRIAILEKIAAKGQEVRLRWLGEAYDVLVINFRWKYLTKRVRATYTITVRVIRDASGSYSRTGPISVDAQVGAQVNTAAALAGTIAGADLGASAQALKSSVTSSIGAIGTLGPIAQATRASVNAALTQINATLALARAYAAALGVTTPLQMISNATALVDQLVLLAANVQSGQSVRTITVQGGNLLTIAAREFGDPELATELAKVNNLVSLTLSTTAITKLVIPPFVGKSHG
jgi:hypothetical protein